MKPKECINSNCKNIIYVKDSELHLPLQCNSCIEKKEKIMKLFKKDSKGKIRELEVKANGDQIIQTSGLLTGRKVTHEKTATPKNVGKANETSPEEQAKSEVQSIINKKLDEGYFRTIEEAESQVVILPMLAKSYDKERRKVNWPEGQVFLQPKLDGMRCLIIIDNNEVTFMSRKGKEITTMDHIKEDIIYHLKEYDDENTYANYVIDGELYAHGLSFQENMKIIKKYRKGQTENVKFHCYDMVSDQKFGIRYSNAQFFLSQVNSDYMEMVYTIPGFGTSDLTRFHSRCLSEGYEGTMIRWGEEGYKVNGRSSNLLKYKDFIDETFKVIDVRPSDANPEQGVVVCQNDKGEFGCGMKFSHAERERILIEKKDYIGETAEVRFFEYTDEGIPRFPVCVGFRLDK